MARLDRNNTNFTMQVFNRLKAFVPESKYSFLKYYQDIVRDFAANVELDSRGLLLYWQMGMGKSIGAIAIAMDMVEQQQRQVIVILAKSLQANMHKTIKKYIRLRAEHEPDYYLAKLHEDELELWIKSHFTYVSMNASNMIEQMEAAAIEVRLEPIIRHGTNFNGKFIIVDEAQNLFKAITNGSKNAMTFYDMVMRSKNLKLIFLSGTPIMQDPFELVPCFNMLGSNIPGRIILPESYSEFYQQFVRDGRIANREKFQNRIMGLVSFLKHGKDAGEFPEHLPISVVRVKMFPEQYVEYLLARDKEKDEFSGKRKAAESVPLTRPRTGSTSTYRVKSRQISNWSAGGAAKFHKILEIIKSRPHQLGLIYSQFTGEGGQASFARFLIENGYELYNDKLEHVTGGGAGEAFAPIIRHLNDLKLLQPYRGDFALGGYLGTHKYKVERAGAGEGFVFRAIGSGDILAYTDGKVVTGSDEILPIAAAAFNGVAGPEVDVSAVRTANLPRFAVISGTVNTDLRAHIIDVFNSPENKHGELIMLLLVSITGATGIDLQCLRHIHIMEPYWVYSLVNQIEHRGVRVNSHANLPPAERNVQTYLYLAVAPQDDTEPTTDEEIYERSLVTHALNSSYLDMLKEVGIECQLNEDNCRVCNPTDTELFTRDLRADIAREDPCKPYREQTLKADSIEYKGKKYYYSPSDESIFGYKVYMFDAGINAYKSLDEADPRFEPVIDAISAATHSAENGPNSDAGGA